MSCLEIIGLLVRNIMNIDILHESSIIFIWRVVSEEKVFECVNRSMHL